MRQDKFNTIMVAVLVITLAIAVVIPLTIVLIAEWGVILGGVIDFVDGYVSALYDWPEGTAKTTFLTGVFLTFAVMIIGIAFEGVVVDG